MQLNLKDKNKCSYDCVSMGEIMLRLDPGEGRIKTARQFTVWEGGGEYNVARGLKRCFGLSTAIITAFADNEIGRLLEDFVFQGGVDTSLIQWHEFDSVGNEVRNGLNFTERGFGVRGALGTVDRNHTAASRIKPDDIDWEDLFGKKGVRWFHTGGIFAALSETTPEVILKAVQVAKKYGTIVSYDLNYRPSLWKNHGGLETCRDINQKIAPYVDVMIGNEEDFTACLGFEIENNDENLKDLNIEGYKQMINQAVHTYPNFKVIATTLRTVKSATVNSWEALCWSHNKIFEAGMRENMEIMDRVGGGDSFAAGLIYGLMELGNPALAVEYGAAHGALAMTTPGDTSMASLIEVKHLVEGGNARVVR